ncbi:RNA 2'-phosphotransferase [Rosistilla ulvae]|uniref:RNA 2'-phosphotransferase n=1 Tax=Rosistilla ulvae TaxID=1930277 RepID=A0A517M125_9BACT|nr:RNA 2'-phosphotransferase [Rosistilla ulvae]QDS88577.1 RNA 2'-phosphotransferase [Rosistilla ulvae]
MGSLIAGSNSVRGFLTADDMAAVVAGLEGPAVSLGTASEGCFGYTAGMNKRLTKICKYLSFILRHHPEAIGVQLEAYGWLEIDTLLKNANAAGKSITREQVLQVVELDEEQAFAISEDGSRIRAVRGHSN